MRGNVATPSSFLAMSTQVEQPGASIADCVAPSGDDAPSSPPLYRNATGTYPTSKLTISDSTEDHHSAPYRAQAFLTDVVEILGVRFERWNEDSATASTTGSEGGAVERDLPSDDVSKPIILYLPGIEGLGTSVEPQLPDLSEKFEVFRMIIGPEDRKTFLTLSMAASQFVDIIWLERGEKTVVVGESFGGMLALRLGQLR